MLGRIRAVTTTASDLAAVEEGYSRYLGYRVVDRGFIDHNTALAWDAPAVAGRPFLTMIPESGTPTYQRFVEQPLPAGYKPLTTFGWNATELLAQDPDVLERQLEGSPFRITHPPKNLDSLPDIRAMQGIGPAGEMLYLTCIKRPVAGYDLPTAKTFVDHCFIVIVAGPDIEVLRSFYRDTFGNESREPRARVVHVLSDAYGLPRDTKHLLTSAPLAETFRIELDEYPPLATVLPKPPGGLPVGMAIVTFEYAGINKFNDSFVAPPQLSTLPGCRDQRTATMFGGAGEMIELLEV